MAIVPGIGVGEAVVMRRRPGAEAPAAAPSATAPVIDADHEIEKLHGILTQLAEELRFIKRKVARGAGEAATRLFDVQSVLLKDGQLICEIEARVRRRGERLDGAIEGVLETYTARFGKLTDPYLKEKVLDVKDVLTRMRERSVVCDARNALGIGQGRVLVAEEILPSAVLAPDGRPFEGIVTVVGGVGAHATILTKSYGIPVVGVPESHIRRMRDGERVVVDGQSGSVYVNPTEELLAELLARRSGYGAYRVRIEAVAADPACTLDGQLVAVHANCGTVSDIDEARAQGADGIGLLRTEFLFRTRSSFPDEDEQLETYRHATAAFPTKPVVIRTLDLGGDKTLPFFLLPSQLNPYLGWRSLRVSFDHPQQFRAQVRAILRAGATGDVRILFPMVTTYWDAQRCGEYVAECRAELDERGVPFNPRMPCGGMIETPAAIVCLGGIAPAFDFMAIGSNDLTQHLLAVDRDNPRVSEFYLPHHPAVATTIHEVVTRCGALGRPVSLCGEMAADPYYLVLLIGLGLRQVSVAPTLVPICKDIIRHVAATEAAAVADRARTCLLADDALEIIKVYLRGNYPDIDQLVREAAAPA